MTIEDKARAYAEKRLANDLSGMALACDRSELLFNAYDMKQAYENGATEALASQWKDPEVELPEEDTQVVVHSPNGRIDVLTFHDGVFIDELGQAHCVDCYLPIPPLKGGDA